MKILDKKTVWQGNFLRTLLITYEDHRGTRRTWEAVERVNCSGIVAVVPVTLQGEVLLIRQFRPVLNSFVMEFPAGLNDRGEPLVEVALRELIEETGFSSDKVSFLAEGPLSSGLTTEVLSVFLAENAVPASPEMRDLYPPDASEDIEVLRIPLSGAHELLEGHAERGDLVDLKIYGLIELARRRMGR
ncbi:MAG: NUDIX hydrolase [Alphaproteobacteria bacterium]|uniref:GDP-mannose pyrophosphatase n=1 Tax=Candidatus Nitrobium versatile TaxID=2884831 RepID=A0A953JBT7_9BACT|nr:NUDIX hydrolase [Candidatus Nitrobium versatile]